MAKQNGDSWTADLPLINAGKPLWVYANVLYPLDAPESGAGYYYSLYTADAFNLSSMVHLASPDQLKAAGAIATLKRSLTIETFEGDWENEWFTYKPEDWARRTHKIYDEQWQAPADAKLAFEVRSAQRNRLVVGIDQYAAEIQLAGNSEWHPVDLAQTDFLNAAGDTIREWAGIKEFRLGAKETLRSKTIGDEQRRTLGADWVGPKPKFRNLRWTIE